MRARYLGYTILVTSILILAALYSFDNSMNEKNLEVCERLCMLEMEASCSIEACLFNLENSGPKALFYVVGLFIAFIGGIGFYLSFSREEKIITQKHYDLTKLSKEEKEVFNYVKRNKEKDLYQGHIVEEFNFPKAKVTRILDRLEKQDLVERKRRGMSNLVVLK